MAAPISNQKLGRALLVAALMAATLFGSRSITDEGAVSMHGDMPRYLMNGVFLYDFLRSGTPWTTDAALDYAQRYYARYPALSIGHHPPLTPVALVPFFATFGVSVFSARLATLAFFLAGVWLVYALGRRLYDEHAAGWAALLFATNPFVVRYGQQVMSEMPSITMTLLALFLLFRFCDTGRARHYALFVGATILSLCAKQLAALLFPVYVLVFATSDRWRRLQRRDILIMTSIGGLLVAPVAIATILFSPFSITAFGEIATHWRGLTALGAILGEIVAAQVVMMLLVAMVAACVMSYIRRDRTIGFSIAWILTVILVVALLVGPTEPARYSILAVPAYALCAAALAFRPPSRRTWWLATTVLTMAVAWQVAHARYVAPIGGSGYERAAQYVLGRGESPTVLMSDPIDTGYFVFFVRKHDEAGRTVVLRSDKVLTTSLMSNLSVENRISDRSEIIPILKTFGTRFLVIADQPTGSEVLDWLREEVKGDRFVERERVPIVSRDARLRDAALVVYEYLDAAGFAPDATVDLRIPLVGREIRVPLADLVTAEPTQ